MPKPVPSDTQEMFNSRCMSNSTMVAEYPDKKQRFAVCQSLWENKGDKKMTKKSDTPKATVIQRKGRRIIGGYGSFVMVDSDNDMVNNDALKTGLKKFMSKKNKDYRNIMWSHEGIQVGKVIEGYGKHKTRVDDKGLYIVAEVRNDIESADRIWNAILSGDLNAFSIGFEPLQRMKHTKESGEHWNEITEINLLEVSICEMPKNALSRYTILSKSKNVIKDGEGNVMTEKTKVKAPEDEPEDNPEDMPEDKPEDMPEDETDEPEDDDEETMSDSKSKVDTIISLIKDLSVDELAELNSKMQPQTKSEVSIDEIRDELKNLQEKDDIKGIDLSELARLVTSYETGTSAKSYALPRIADGKLDWHSAISKSIDNITEQMKDVVTNKSKINNLELEISRKAEEVENAKKEAEEAKQETAQAEKKVEQAVEEKQEVVKTAEADRQVLDEVQKSMKSLDETLRNFDNRLEKLEKVKVTKTEATGQPTKEQLLNDYRPSNVIEDRDMVEIQVE